ncbi:MAG: hypothetical protein JXP73_05085 [Deltaproteobacteria bacterium]|nr:hypothetical protein [Deltaproteobacteria bacterium]
MRFPAIGSMIVLLSLASCDGDSSVLMSVWNDAGPGDVAPGPGGAAGGQGGNAVPAAGGAGGGAGGASGAGSIVVPGGARDLTTAMCISSTGGTCVAPAGFASCLQANCNAKLVACYYSDGVSSAAGGVCQAYANCMLASPCDANGTNYQNDCALNYASNNFACATCLASLVSCSTTYGCGDPFACSFP